MSIWTNCAGIVQTLIANPSKRGAFLAIFTWTRQLVVSRPVELCEVQTYLATDLAKSRVSSRVAAPAATTNCRAADTRPPIAAPYLWEDDEVDGGAVETLPHAEEADHVRTQYHHPGAALVH
jgi:hypothetical protein